MTDQTTTAEVTDLEAVRAERGVTLEAGDPNDPQALTEEERVKFSTSVNIIATLAAMSSEERDAEGYRLAAVRTAFNGVPVAVISAIRDDEPDEDGDETVSITPLAIVVTEDLFEHLQDPR